VFTSGTHMLPKEWQRLSGDDPSTRLFDTIEEAREYASEWTSIQGPKIQQRLSDLAYQKIIKFRTLADRLVAQSPSYTSYTTFRSNLVPLWLDNRRTCLEKQLEILLQKAREVVIDCEFVHGNPKLPSLIQLLINQTHLVILDVKDWEGPLPGRLVRILQDPAIRTVWFGGSMERSFFQGEHKLSCSHVLDLQSELQRDLYCRQVSLGLACKLLLGWADTYKLSPGAHSMWGDRPLCHELKEHAEADVIRLGALYHVWHHLPFPEPAVQDSFPLLTPFTRRPRRLWIGTLLLVFVLLIGVRLCWGTIKG
jgi:hypothetical protein